MLHVHHIITSRVTNNDQHLIFYQIEVLPEIVKAVQGTGVEVYMDGGVRLGTDVLKALALGARAVFVGRPVPWGLAYKVQHKSFL